MSTRETLHAASRRSQAICGRGTYGFLGSKWVNALAQLLSQIIPYSCCTLRCNASEARGPCKTSLVRLSSPNLTTLCADERNISYTNLQYNPVQLWRNLVP